MEKKAHTSEKWILGGCSGRMITTKSGYFGDGFIADFDTLANATLCCEAVNNYALLVCDLQKTATEANELKEQNERLKAEREELLYNLSKLVRQAGQYGAFADRDDLNGKIFQNAKDVAIKYSTPINKANKDI